MATATLGAGRPASPAHDASGGVQQPVAQRLGLGLGQLSVEAEQAQPGQEVGAGEHQLAFERPSSGG